MIYETKLKYRFKLLIQVIHNNHLEQKNDEKAQPKAVFVLFSAVFLIAV
jgi:hypothetical protein